jgi:putative membrane protein
MTTALLLASHDHDWFPFFPLIPLAFFALAITAFVLIGRRRCRAFPGRTGESVLAERYARGEIDATEFRQRRDVLRAKDRSE